MNTAQQIFFELPVKRPTETSRRDGYYLCSHCREVLTPSLAQIEIAANAPDANPALKCSHCHKHTVHWMMPWAAKLKPKRQPISDEAGRKFFAGIFRMLAEI